jgi:hypothetical protein
MTDAYLLRVHSELLTGSIAAHDVR